MVRPDWGIEYSASSLAICRSGGEKGEKRTELERRGLGRHSTQDGAVNSEHEVSDLDPHAMVSCCLINFGYWRRAFFER